MARIARVIAPGFPHHVTQRGNRRQETFFCDEDYQAYLDLMAEWCRRCRVDIWAWCLMPNHVHLIAVPQSEEGLARAFGEAHRRYTRRINFREGWRGHLWQERFASFPMDESYLLAAARYVELNSVQAGLAKSPEEYRWSSARAHLEGKDDTLVKVSGRSGDSIFNYLTFTADLPNFSVMARIARVIAPGFPHHVTQRGNRRQETFFCEGFSTSGDCGRLADVFGLPEGR